MMTTLYGVNAGFSSTAGVVAVEAVSDVFDSSEVDV